MSIKSDFKSVLKSAFSALAIAAAVTLGASSANAVVFNMTYDDTPNGVIDGTVVGNGVLSYDGSPSAGFFTLDTLTGLAFSVSFTTGASWTLADLATPPADAAIFVTDLGGGIFSVVFAGDGSTSPLNGSADFSNAPSGTLTHEPTNVSGVGCCGGNSIVNLYATEPSLDFGDYTGITAAIPEPGALALFGLGLAGLGIARRRKAARSAHCLTGYRSGNADRTG